MAGVVNYDLPRGTINTVFQHGFDPEYVESYRRYYASVNPWMDFWAGIPSGQVGVSERDSPASAFRDSEFYTEWLAPQQNAAVAGLRLHVDAHNTIQLAWHYGVERAAAYDEPAAAVLEAIKPSLVEAVRGASILRAGIDQALRLGGLMERIDGIAVMLDRDRRIREANTEAVNALQQEDIISSAGSILAMRDAAAQRWLEETLSRLLDRMTVTSTVATFSGGDRVFRVTLTRAPDQLVGHGALLVPSLPQAMLVVKILIGRSVRMDVADLRVAFGLSAGEIKLCEALVNGLSLAEASVHLGVSEGTVRQRVKMIFHKTGTHRQGELVALLAQFRVSGQTTDDS